MDFPKKILLIDSDNEHCDAIKAAFANMKYKVLRVDTAISGIQKMLQFHPDLILYNISIDSSNGVELFYALRFTPSFSHIPVVFYKDKNDQQIQYLMNNNWYIQPLKMQNQADSINLIPQLVQNEKGSDEELTYDFNTLFHLSPNGIFIFDKNGILSINRMLMNLLKRKEQDLSSFKTKDLFEKSSAKAIKHWMKNYLSGDTTPFNKQVILIDGDGGEIPMLLMLSELKREDSSVHFIGLLQAAQGNNLMVNYQLAGEVCNLLKRENIAVSEALEKKITHTIKLRTIDGSLQKKSFFTRREDEVLRLSMEGLSIKVIADKLSLSTRTVEKYRTKLMLKSGAKNFVEVIVFSLKNNLIKI